MKRLTTMVFAAALFLSACGNDAAVEVRPFEEVQASEFVFENDPTNPSRGIFRMTTTEAMICAIVWGETTDLGNFNNSLNMAGTGIVQHDVFLPGAEPGVEYHYVVQGTTADGTLYRSEMATFTLDDRATAPDDDPGVNLAEGAEIVEFSSEFNQTFGVANAFDGDLSTEWSTAGDGDEAFVTVDLGAPTEVAAVSFLTRSMTDGSAIAETFTVSADGGEPLGPFPAGNPAEPTVNEVEITGQIFTFEIESSTGGNTGAVEIRLFAP